MAAGTISVCLSKPFWPPGRGSTAGQNPGTSGHWLGTAQPGTVPRLARTLCAPVAGDLVGVPGLSRLLPASPGATASVQHPTLPVPLRFVRTG